MKRHGQTPLAGATPVVTARDEGGKPVGRFAATPTGKTGAIGLLTALALALAIVTLRRSRAPEPAKVIDLKEAA